MGLGLRQRNGTKLSDTPGQTKDSSGISASMGIDIADPIFLNSSYAYGTSLCILVAPL